MQRSSSQSSERQDARSVPLVDGPQEKHPDTLVPPEEHQDFQHQPPTTTIEHLPEEFGGVSSSSLLTDDSYLYAAAHHFASDRRTHHQPLLEDLAEEGLLVVCLDPHPTPRGGGGNNYNDDGTRRSSARMSSNSMYPSAAGMQQQQQQLNQQQQQQDQQYQQQGLHPEICRVDNDVDYDISSDDDDSVLQQARNSMREFQGHGLRDRGPVVSERRPSRPVQATALPAMPVPTTSRVQARTATFNKGSKPVRLPDLAVGVVHQTNGGNAVLLLQSNEHVVPCKTCRVELRVVKAAVVVQCPVCRQVSPCSSSSTSTAVAAAAALR